MRIHIFPAILLALTCSPITAKRPPFTSINLEDLNKGLDNNPKATARLLSSATRVDGKPNPHNTKNDPSSRSLEENDAYNNHIAQYSIQFQGCHHIQQWNSEDYYDDDIRVLTKRLVRFRLVPYQTCEVVPAWAGYLEAVKNKVGRFDDFGEYIVDLNDFVYSYLIALSQGKGSGEGSNCEDYGEACEDACGEDADDDCLNECYGFYSCNNDDAVDEEEEDEDEQDEIDPMDYAQCAELEDYEPAEEDDDGDDEEDGDDDEKKYYYGPYCADHGAEIRMGLFSDDTCSTTAKCNGGATRGANCYYQNTGQYLPYSKLSIVQDACVTCSNNYIALDRLERQREAVEEDGGDINVEYEFGYTRDVCANIYDVSGKCETHMSEGYQYENACEYIEGIKIAVNEDGVAMGVMRSSKADMVLAGLAASTALVGMYLYYLKFKFESPAPGAI